MNCDKQKKHERNENEQKVGRSIKDKREKYDTKSIQFYTGRQCRNNDYLEMNKRSSSKENTGITDTHKRSGFDRKLTVAPSSQENVNGLLYHGNTKYANREMLKFQDHDYNHSKRYQQDGFYYDNRRTHPNYLSDRHELANIDPYYYSDRPQTQRLYYMTSNDKYWPETIDHDRQQPYSSCSSNWY